MRAGWRWYAIADGASRWPDYTAPVNDAPDATVPQAAPSAALRRTGRELVMFLVVGAISTAVYVGLYNVLREWLSPYPANVLAVFVSFGASFWGNRRFTFPQARPRPAGRQFIEFSVVVGLTLVVSNAALALTLTLAEDPDRLLENVALIASVGASTMLRFWLLRRWVFS